MTTPPRPSALLPMTLTPEPDSLALDNAIWSALTGPHAALALGDAVAKRYPSDVAPFGAVRALNAESLASLAAQLAEGESVALSTPSEIQPFGGLVPLRRSALEQMVMVDPSALDSVPTLPAQPLTAADVPDMLQLASLTQPGPFGPRTIALGDYIGLRIDGELVAMAGERMKLPGFAEISAVCVAPQCRGRGHAAALMKQLALSMLARGETPFLHVVRENVSAIALYERLGFKSRGQFHLGVFGRPAA